MAISNTNSEIEETVLHSKIRNYLDGEGEGIFHFYHLVSLGVGSVCIGWGFCSCVLGHHKGVNYILLARQFGQFKFTNQIGEAQIHIYEKQILAGRETGVNKFSLTNQSENVAPLNNK